MNDLIVAAAFWIAFAFLHLITTISAWRRKGDD